MTVLEHTGTLSEIIEKITEYGHSRFPLIDDDKDEVVGILLAKDLTQLSEKTMMTSRFMITFVLPPLFRRASV